MGEQQNTQQQTPLVDTIKQAVQTALEPVNQQVEELAKRVTENAEELAKLAAPRSQAGMNGAALMGRAPAVRTGENPLASRGYQFARLIFALATRDWSQAKVEKEVHDKLYDVYGGHLGEGTILAPLGSEHLQRLEPGLAREIRQMVRQGVAGADLDEIRWLAHEFAVPGVRQDMSVWDETGGAVLLGAVQQGEMIDLLRAREVLSQAGAREFTLPPNGRIQFPRKTSGADAFWVGEGEAITETEVRTGLITMIAKKLAAIIPVPNELIRFATASVEAFLRDELAAALAGKADESMLVGTDGGGVAPRGLIYYDDVQTATAGTVGANGDTLEPEDLDRFVALVEEQDVDPANFTFILRPQLWAALKNRRADAITEGDGRGPFLFRYESRALQGDTLNGYRFIRSTKVPRNRTKGSASNLTMLIGGVFRHYLIGRVGVLEFAINTQSDTNFRQDLTSVRAIQHLDGRPRYEQAFVVVDTLVVA